MMDYVLFLFENRANLVSALVVLALALVCIILVAEYKSRIIEVIINARNKRRAALEILLALLVLLATKWSWNNAVVIGIAIAFLVNSFLLIELIKPFPRRPTCPFLGKYHNNWLNGDVLSGVAFFESEHEWFIKTWEIEFLELKSSYMMAEGHIDKAYEALKKIQEKYLYEEEKNYFNTLKAKLLVLMGDVASAKVLLGEAENNTSRNPEVWLSYAMIAEYAGDLDAAYEYVKKAKSLIVTDKLTSAQKAMVYNDFGRMYVILGNMDEALYYYKKAYNCAQLCKGIELYRLIAQNLIMHMAIMDGNHDDCEKIICEYEARIKNESIENYVSFGNCRLAYYRQIGNARKESQLIREDYYKVKALCNHEQLEIYKSTTFCVIMHGPYPSDWFDSEVSAEPETYDSLSVDAKITVFANYIEILSMPEFSYLKNHDVYMRLYNLILNYYKTDALNDLKKLLDKVSPGCVFKELDIKRKTLEVLKYNDKGYHIDNNIDKYLELSNLLGYHGLKVEATQVKIDLLNECRSFYNQAMLLPGKMAVTLQDWYERNINHNMPEFDSDGIHLITYSIKPPLFAAIIPTKIAIVEKYIDEVKDEVRAWRSHPRKYNAEIELAILYLGIGRNDEARQLLEDYVKSGLSDDIFPPNLRNTIAEMRIVFGL